MHSTDKPIRTSPIKLQSRPIAYHFCAPSKFTELYSTRRKVTSNQDVIGKSARQESYSLAHRKEGGVGVALIEKLGEERSARLFIPYRNRGLSLPAYPDEFLLWEPEHIENVTKLLEAKGFGTTGEEEHASFLVHDYLRRKEVEKAKGSDSEAIE